MSNLNGWISQRNQEYQRKTNAWLKAVPIQGYDSNQFRRDAYGGVIAWKEYGQTSAYGWEIDHELPKSQFPTIATQPSNLRALHWKNNRAKSNKIDIATLLKIARGTQ